MFTVSVYAMEAVDMRFTKNTDGKYIYCNNREFIYPSDLADISNPNPCYIMNNDNLTEDKYTIFISHVNHTETRDSDKKIIKPGYDIETDVVFIANEDSIIRLTAVGFQIPENVRYYIDGRTYTEERDWGCFGAWASYLQTVINQKDSGQKYYPIDFEPVEFEVKKGEMVWLSKYIPNYEAVPFYRTVHIIADFEILEGNCNVNVAALKSNGTLGDRSNLAGNIARGRYVYDRQYKGIADCRNSVDTNLSFSIDDSVSDGTYVPVIVHNRFVPDGNTVTTWFTNINPSADIWNKLSGAEDSMIRLEYKDGSKLSYYGKNSENKNDVWIFDTEHSDLAVNNPDTGIRNSDFEPNFQLEDDTDEEFACNIANYGVFYNYHITVENTGNIDRYISYVLNTSSNNLIILRDDKGQFVSGYPMTKGNSNGIKERDVMANIAVPAQKTITFTLTVVLTTNHVGGMENTLVINNYPTPVETYDTKRNFDVKDISFTGREYVEWRNGILYKSDDKENWTETGMDKATAELFNGQWGQYKFVYTGNGYIAKNCIYDGSLYKDIKDLFNKVYLLDENFKLISVIKLYSYAKEVSAANDLIYVYTDTKYYSDDNGYNWKNINSALELPLYNFGSFVASYGNGTVNLSTTGIYFNPVIYDGFSPEYLQTLGDLYYFVKENTIYYSYDGVYWNYVDAGTKINMLGRINDKFFVNDDYLIDIPQNNNNTVIRYKDTYLGLNTAPFMIDGVTYIPLRSFCVTSGMSIVWNEEAQSALVSDGENSVLVSNEQAVYIDDKMYVPVRWLGERLGYTVNYNNDYNLVRITQ